MNEFLILFSTIKFTNVKQLPMWVGSIKHIFNYVEVFIYSIVLYVLPYQRFCRVAVVSKTQFGGCQNS